MKVRQISSIGSLEKLGLSKGTLKAIKEHEISASKLVVYAREHELSEHLGSDSRCVEEVLNALYREGFVFHESPGSWALRQAMAALGIIKGFGTYLEYESRHEFSDEDVDRIKNILQDLYNETQSKNGEDVSKLEAEFEETFINSRGLIGLDLTVRTWRVLEKSGITTVGQLRTMTEDDLMRVHNVGRSGVEEIKFKMKSLGLSLREGAQKTDEKE